MSLTDRWKEALAPQSDFTAKIGHDNLIRWWVSVFALLIAFILWGADFITSIGPIVGLFLSYNFLQGLSWIFIKCGRTSETLDLALHAIDNLAITTSIYWTGGTSSSFYFLYAIPVIVEAYHKNLKGLIFNGLLGLVFYAALTLGIERTFETHRFIEVLARITFLGIFCAVSGVSIQLLRKRERSLQKHLIEQRTAAHIHELVSDLVSRKDFPGMAQKLSLELTQTTVKPQWHCRVWLMTEDWQTLSPYGENPGALQEIRQLSANTCPALKSKSIFHLENTGGKACFVEQFSYGSHLCLPVMTQQEIFGVLFIGSPEENAFSEEDVRYLDSVSKTITAGLERVSELEELQFSYEVGSRALTAFLNSTKGMDATISAILDGVVKILNVDRANVMLWEPKLQVLQTRWFRGAQPPEQGRIALGMGQGIAGNALKYNQPCWASDVAGDPNFVPSQGRIRSLLAMPMQTSDGKPLGVINALTLERSRHFTKRDIDFISLFSKQAALALENALLHEEGSRQIGKLRELDQMKSEFLSRVSHELRGPLTAIQGFVDVIGSKMNGPVNSKQMELLGQIDQATKAQMRMVEGLLDLASIERGSWSINKGPCVLPQILKEEFEKARLFAAAQGIRMLLHIPSKPVPPIEADAERLRQVVWNLLHNAIKYTRPSDTVTLNLEMDENQLQISVCDTGAGIPPDSLEKIFEKFYQAHGEQSKRAGGLGLGLALAKEIVEAHEGFIRAESPGLGKGSTFTFTIPRLTTPQNKAA